MSLPYNRLKDFKQVMKNFRALDQKIGVSYYAEMNGGAGDIAIPNTTTDTFLVHADGVTRVQAQWSTGPSGGLWMLEGTMLVRADSANDCILKVGLILNGTLVSEYHIQRAYFGTTTNLQGWTLGCPRRRMTLSPNTSYTLQIRALAYSAIGGFYSRSDPVNGGMVHAFKVG